MSYYTRFRGYLESADDLEWHEIRNAVWRRQNRTDADPYQLFTLEMESVTLEVDDGELTRKFARKFWPDSDPVNHCHAGPTVEFVQAILDAFPGHAFTSTLLGMGEEWTDLFRISIEDGRAVALNARIEWSS